MLTICQFCIVGFWLVWPGKTNWRVRLIQWTSRGWIHSCLWMVHEWARHELWIRYLLFGSFDELDISCVWNGAWTLQGNDLSSCPTKNSSKSSFTSEDKLDISCKWLRFCGLSIYFLQLQVIPIQKIHNISKPWGPYMAARMWYCHHLRKTDWLMACSAPTPI